MTTPYLFERPIAELILRSIFLTRFRITVVVSFRYSIIGTQSYRNMLSRCISTVITLRDCHLQLTIAYHRGTCVCRDSGPWLRGGPQSSDTTQKAPSGCYIESLLRGCIGRHRGCAYVEIANLLPLLNIAGYTRGGASRSTVDTSSICANGSPTVATPKNTHFRLPLVDTSDCRSDRSAIRQRPCRQIRTCGTEFEILDVTFILRETTSTSA